MSILQMIVIAYNSNDWTSLWGSPTKLGLALFSIGFDFLFFGQHYVCYRTRSVVVVEIGASPPQSTLDTDSVDTTEASHLLEHAVG
ncbi:unnamed protein product [Schistocephalus solidus]|uniref:Cystinosin homolog n=1 Tax=Schistocephalus solidus TaxID=70667 RepID=A0A3P7D4T3_SCHSO|nr:unnamed protein product [Schistocephalus solidus]